MPSEPVAPAPPGRPAQPLPHRHRPAGIEPVVGAALPTWIEAAVVMACCAAVVGWLDPVGMLSDNTPTGGDMGAHVWGPAYLRDVLLPAGSLRGWTPDWYAGMPAMQFYMVLPYLMIVAADVVLPYGVAFKLVAVSGVATMPAAAWLMCRLAGWPRLLRALAPTAALLFVFDVNFAIYGGNAASMLAGEFAFSLALSGALVYLGMLWRSLETGTGRARAGLLLAFVALCHPIPLAFAVAASVLMVAVRSLHALPGRIGRPRTAAASTAAAAVWAVVWIVTDAAVARLAVPVVAVGALLALDWRRSAHALVIGTVGGLVSAFWTVPFVTRRGYLNDLGWAPLDSVAESLFLTDWTSHEATRHGITWLLVLAGIGVAAGLRLWRRPVMTWATIAFMLAMAFAHWPEHRLWNARILPFWYLSVYLLAAMGLWLLAESLMRLRLRGGSRARLARRVNSIVAAGALAAALGLLALRFGDAPGGSFGSDGSYRWGPFVIAEHDLSYVEDWARWNFRGYEARDGHREYREFIGAMSDVGERHGCGRLMWEYDIEVLDTYGTPMALMLLPYWTDGCISSMEGLYFESSPTVPFHFLMQAELSRWPSHPMSGLPYSDDLDFSLGVAHLQMSGVRYYASLSAEATEAARTAPGLQLIATSGPWSVYLVADSEVVSALAYEPAVAADASHAGRAWTDPAVTWWNDPAAWDVPVAANGPPQWSRVQVLPPVPAGNSGDAGPSASPARFGAAPRRALPPVQIDDIDLGRDRLSFTVDRMGVPVLVKVSYFPNWRAHGAQGPYRVTPNWMVVVPTDRQVELAYGATAVEYGAWLLTLLGAATLVFVARRPPTRFDRPPTRRLAGVRSGLQQAHVPGPDVGTPHEGGQAAEAQVRPEGDATVIAGATLGHDPDGEPRRTQHGSRADGADHGDEHGTWP